MGVGMDVGAIGVDEGAADGSGDGARDSVGLCVGTRSSWPLSMHQ